MIARRRVGAVAAAFATTLGAVLIALPTSASAAVSTTVAFESTDPVTVAFGENWNLTLSVSSTYDEGPTVRLLPTDGTVDVYFSGIAGPFAAGLPIQPDGLVYVSQPANQPLLSAGEYEVSAIFNPAPGAYYGSSQTATPLSFTVTALEAKPAVEVVYDASVSERPVITATIAGSYVEASGGAPAGTWRFVVANSAGEPVFDEELAQLHGATEPLRVEIDSKLARGETYSVTSTFTPVDELAGGLIVADITDAEFQTPGGTFGEALTGIVPMPLWLAIVLLVLLAGVIAAAVVLAIKLSGRTAVTAAAESSAPQRVPGDPLHVEVVSLEEIGLPEPTIIPELRPEGHTQQLPESTTWLLSDVEPSTRLPDASEAPTERLDTVDAAELAAETPESDSNDDEPEKA